MTQKMTSGLRMAALALAAVGVQQSAQAFTYNANDVFLVFHTTTKDMLVNLGSYTQFNKMDGNTINISAYNTTDLASVGSVSGVNWGVFSWKGTVPKSLFSTAAPGAAPAVSSAQTAVGSTITGIANGSVSPTDGGASYSAGTTVLTQYTTNSSSFTGITGGDGAMTLDPTRNVLQGVGGNSSAELYQFNANSSGTDLGTFKLDGVGNMTFQSVPEPGTYALLGLGAMGMYFFRRFRK